MKTNNKKFNWHWVKRFNTRKSIVKILKSLLLEGQISWWISLKINDWKQFRRQKRSRRRQIYFKLYRFTNFHLKFNFQVWDFNIVCKVVLASKKTKCSSHMKGSIKLWMKLNNTELTWRDVWRDDRKRLHMKCLWMNLNEYD